MARALQGNGVARRGDVVQLQCRSTQALGDDPGRGDFVTTHGVEGDESGVALEHIPPSHDAAYHTGTEPCLPLPRISEEQ